MMSCQSGGRRLCLSMLNDQLTCKLCGGYFIDATTIIECLHSFCRSCIVKYLETNQYCPICEVQVHESKPLINIRPDHTLQDIVYKLVPSCYQNEMRRRREFYEKHPGGRNGNMSPEARGEPIESHIYSPDESLSLSLEYYSPNLKEEGGEDVSKDGKAALPKRYLRCPAAVTVFHLQKLIRAKYGLTEAHRIDIMYKEEPLCSDYTLMDVMYIYHWRRKVPLHLSYRIFESSPKRIKLSEENEDYKQSLSNAGISSVETKEEHRNNHQQQKQTIKREWKEVQLKISETGVMSVTDISVSPEGKSKSTKIEEETTAKKATEKSRVEKPAEDDDDEVDKSDIPLNQRIALQAAEKSSVKHEETKPPAKKGANKKSRVVNSTEETTKLEPAKGGTKPAAKGSGEQSDAQKTNASQKAQEKSAPEESAEKPAKAPEEKPTSDSKKLLNNNNNNSNNNNNNSINSSNITDNNQKGKTSGSGGSKIDALSAKLQFQPKLGQVNNTYSKKTPKEKKNLAGLKKSEVKITEILKIDGKNSLESLKVKSTRANCGNAMSTTQTTAVSTTTTAPTTTAPTAAATTNSKVSTSTSQSKGGDSGTSSSIHGSSTGKEPKANVPQTASSNAERKANPPAETIVNDANERKSVPTSSSSKLPFSRNNGVPFCPTGSDNLASIGLTVSAAMLNMAQASSVSSFPYTVHDLVNTNSLLRLPTSKASKTSSSSAAKQQQGNQASTSTTGGGSGSGSASASSSASSLAQVNMQTLSMSIYSISTSSGKQNPYANATTTVTATTAATTTTGQNASKQATKGNVEMSSAYATPPCPDAIPISLMKPTVRKHEIIAKGTNLNEICAKIGTSGSKINDICAKIGESTKEKNRIESRNRMDIPDLLKITKKSHPAESLLKHIPNIPNVPIYTPSSSLSIDKSAYSIKDKANSSSASSPIMSTTTASGGASLQKNPALKKQTAMGYKTLRDPPKSWNPTLSKNNYVAVKNQSKELLQAPSTSDNLKTIPSKPAKIFKMRNVPRYLGNPASGVKPMYGVSNESKDKDQGANSGSGGGNNGNLNSSKNSASLMMKIDPKTLSPIVSTSSVNSPIVSPPPYSPNRNYQNAPPSFPREICRNNVVGSSAGGTPISPRNSPVNMLSTNPFIPSPTPNTNPRLIYSHFPPPFPDPSAFPNPLIRSPIGIPPPSAFHSSLPPSVNKLYQRTSYNIPQTTNYSTVTTTTTPPSVQRVPPSTHSSSTSTSTSSSSSLSSSSTSTSASTPISTSSSTSTSSSSSSSSSSSTSSSSPTATSSSVSSSATSVAAPSSSSSTAFPSSAVSKSETTATSKVETVALQLSTKQETKEAFNLSNKSERSNVSDLSSKSTANNAVTGTSGTSTSTVTSTTAVSGNVTVTTTSASTTTATVTAASPKRTSSSPVKSKDANKKEEKAVEEKKEPEANKKVKDEGGTPKEEKESEKDKKEDKDAKSSTVPPKTDAKATEANGEVDKEKSNSENQKEKLDEKKEKDKEKSKLEEKDIESPVEKKSVVDANKVSEKIEVRSNDRKLEDEIGKANEQSIGKKNEIRNKAES